MAKLHPALKNKEFWYQDLLLVCNNLPNFERSKVDLTSKLSCNITLKIPFISSPMDTVTEAKMAILMALTGGIGAIHYNMPPEIQAHEVKKVKRFEAGFVKEPVVLSAKHTVADIYNYAKEYDFWSYPITKDGTIGSRLVGIVTRRDVRYLETKRELSLPLQKVMTPLKSLITAPKETTLDRNNIRAANKIIRKHNLDTLPIVDKHGRIVALVTDSDLRKNESYPDATKDDNKQLKVLSAIESRYELAKVRLKHNVEAGVDGVIIDASIVFWEQIKIAKHIKKKYPHLEVIMGNVDSKRMVSQIIKEAEKEVDGIRVGVGPGAACITQQQLGIGRPQASAVWECSQKNPIPIIADGGIKGPSDIVKAFALGAQSVMMGGLLAGLEESPGDTEFDENKGYLVKKYRGMGSMEAMQQGGAVRYRVDNTQIKIAEGKVKKVGYKGSGHIYIPTLIAAVKQSMQKLGFKNINNCTKDSEIIPNRLN